MNKPYQVKSRPQPKPKQPRDKTILLRLSEEELSFLKQNAEKLDMLLSHYIRMKLMWHKYSKHATKEKVMRRKSGERQGDRYYYNVNFTGNVKEQSLESSVTNEKQYWKNFLEIK
jgi:hypothetical protein